jgi:hypothetical protein
MVQLYTLTTEDATYTSNFFEETSVHKQEQPHLILGEAVLQVATVGLEPTVSVDPYGVFPMVT